MCSACLADLIFPAGKDLAYCNACGRVNARPKSNAEKTNLLKYANQLRAFGNFREAESYYRDVLAQRMDEHEARMGLVYCRYGVIHVKDERAERWLPTCRLENGKPMATDADFRQAYADAADEGIRAQYMEDAEYIDRIQRRIAALNLNAEPYDVFICYKETDLDDGRRTEDSEIAGDIYEALSNQGLRVFYARKTLNKQLGADYEAQIYHAIRTSGMMLVVGTKAEHFRATWVRSEWRRLLDDIDAGMEKCLVPVFKGMHENGLPTDFVSYRFQGVNLDKFGAGENLLKMVVEYAGKKRVESGKNGVSETTENAEKEDEIHRLQQELERLKKAEEERKLKEELERLRKIEAEFLQAEELKKREAEEAARKAEEERKKREAEAARKAEEERKKREAEAARKAEEERKKREAEAARKAEEERKKREAEGDGDSISDRDMEEIAAIFSKKRKTEKAAPSKRYSLEEIEAVDWGKYLKDDSGDSKKAHVGADGEISDSWPEIFKAIDSGEYKKRYAIGNTKALDLGPEGVVHMQIAAFDTDERADGKGKAPITWISRELLKNGRRMNPKLEEKKGFFKTTYVVGTGSIGGWEKCELRAALQKEVFPLVPAEVRERIREVSKQHDAYNERGNKFRQTTHDRLWIPSREEVFDGGYGKLFVGDSSRKKKKVGSSSASWWWLRSASITYNVSNVYTDGSTSYYTAGNSGGLALGFCT